MSLRSITVFTDQFDGSGEHLENAIAIADAHQAHLAVVGVAEEPPFNYVAGAELAVESWVNQVGELREEIAAVADKAAARAAEAGLSSEARSLTAVLGNIADAAAMHARYADIALVRAPRGDGAAMQTEVVDGIIFSSGRPALILPREIQVSSTAKQAVIAWDGGREAARATFDALPLLRQGASVSVALVDPGSEIGDEPGADIARALTRHGLDVTVDRLPDLGKGVAQALRDHAAGIGADLLVMGGYGHSRLREIVFGGVTRDILSDVTVPTLMSH